MSTDFSKFDDIAKSSKVAELVQNAPSQEFDDVPKGTYVCSIEKMEIKPTKAGDKLMFALQLKIKETVESANGKAQDKRFVFFNRVVCGNKNTEKWNDGVAIKGVLTFLEALSGEEGYEFTSYSDLSNLVLDLYQELSGSVEVEIKYDPDKFNPVTISEVYDL